MEALDSASLEICGGATGGRVVVTDGPVVVSRRGDSIREPVAGSKVTFH